MPSVYFQKSRFCWACSWKQSGKTLVKYFKSKAEAVAFKPTARPSAISAPVVSDFSTIITQYLGTLKVRDNISAVSAGNCITANVHEKPRNKP